MNSASSSESEDDRPPTIESIETISYQGGQGQNQFQQGMGSTPLTTSNFLSNYENLGKIGEGNNGAVHLFQRIKNGKKYAVKIMGIDQETQSLVRKNYLQVCTLRTSPNLVKYRGMHSDLKTGICYLVMQYYDFPKLDPKIGYPEDELKIIASQILEGLESLHKKMFYHRDIKPDNILYHRANKKIIIVDLGVGRMVKKGEAGTIAGTPSYRAPEMGKAGYDHKVDIYSLGITLYELVTGAIPMKKLSHVAANEKKKHQLPDFNEPQWKQYSKQLRLLVEKMICYEPSQRYDASQCLSHPWFIKKLSPDPEKQLLEGVDGQKRFRSQARHKQMEYCAGNSYQIQKKSSVSTPSSFVDLLQIDSPVAMGSDDEF